MHKVVFEKYPDFFDIVKVVAYAYYSKWISKVISKERKQEIEFLNRQRAMYNEVTLKEVKNQESPIPTRKEYYDTIMARFRERKRQKRMERRESAAMSSARLSGSWTSKANPQSRNDSHVTPDPAEEEELNLEIEQNFF